MNLERRFQELAERTEPVSIEVLDALYDQLEPIEETFMLGEWEGGVFNTGHPAEQQLHAVRWAGKAFRSVNDADPIVCAREDGTRYANEIMGKATLRAVRYRGVVTATMIYDSHPIFDHFKKISESLVLGVMDRKGDTPGYFYLKRL